MRPAFFLLFASLGLLLIWLPLIALGEQTSSPVTLMSNVLASAGLFVLLGLLKRLRKPRK
ncbi:MAG: hypothetical protein ACOC28_06705 [Alkalispirochaetaceae bacterium]